MRGQFETLIGEAATLWRNRLARRRTRRIVEKLPLRIQRDIGWPEIAPDRVFDPWSGRS